MRVWHVWDFPDKVYIKFDDNFRELFFHKMFKKFGGKRSYARYLGSAQFTIKSYAKGYTYKNGLKHEQAIPVSLIKKSLHLFNNKFKRKLESRIILLKCRGDSSPIISPRLPFKESPSLYRIVAHMTGDGSAPGNKVPYYANTCKELIAQFNKDLEIFGEVKSYGGKLTVPIISFPKVITDILAHILNVRFSFPDRIPKSIFDASEKCKSAFLQALFDDEGTISTSLAFGMSNQNIVNEISMLTEALYIKVNNVAGRKNRDWKDYFSFTIKRESLREFQEKIGFFHPMKKENLDFAIKTQNRKQRTRDFKSIHHEIFNSLSNTKKTTLEIANNIELTLGHTLRYLKSLESEGKVIRSGFKNKSYWFLNQGFVHSQT